MQQIFPFFVGMNKKAGGKKNVEMSFVVMSPAASAAPTGVLLSGGNVKVEGNSSFSNVKTLTRTIKQQLPSPLRANWYVPLISVIVLAVLTLGASNVCQSGLALLKYSARATASANCVGAALLV